MSDTQVMGDTFSDFVDHVYNSETATTSPLTGFLNSKGGHLSFVTDVPQLESHRVSRSG